MVNDDDWSVGFQKQIQSEGDLGKRMEAAFETVLEKESMAVIIGSDCPELSSELIEEAFKKLEIADIVIGPTHDGGYYLLGMKSPSGFLFENMEWSIDTVYQETINRIRSKSLLYTVLSTLSDLDNIHDLEKFPEFQ